MQRAQKGGCAASRPHWHLSVALPRVEFSLAEKRQGTANTQGRNPRVARPLRGEARKAHLLTVCGQPAASSRLRHAYMQSAAVHLKNCQVARADRRAPLSYGQPKQIKFRMHA